MSALKQATLGRSVTFEGVGIHSGRQVRVVVHPATVGVGICFERSDLGGETVQVGPEALVQTARATLLKNSAGVGVMTPEHFLAACYGLGLTNLRVEISSEELPIMDGSALVFAEAFQTAGVVFQSENCKSIQVKTPLWVRSGDQQVLVLPSYRPRWTYCLSYEQPFIGDQIFEWNNHPDTFVKEISPARTYGFYAEVQALLDRGLALGGSLDNALVIGETGYINTPRFDDELCRHKLLDLIGDFSVLGAQIQGHIIGLKSGHALHMKMVNCLKL